MATLDGATGMADVLRNMKVEAVGDGYGVAQGKRASQGGDLGVDQRFGDFTLGSTVVAL